MITPTPKNPPQYSQKTLIGIIRRAKDLDDLAEIGSLMNALSDAGDFPISIRMRYEMNKKTMQFVYGGDHNKNQEL